MIANLVRIQKKIAEMSNRRMTPQQTHEALEELAAFVNKMSPFEIVDVESKTIVRNKKTLKEIDL